MCFEKNLPILSYYSRINMDIFFLNMFNKNWPGCLTAYRLKFDIKKFKRICHRASMVKFEKSSGKF